VLDELAHQIFRGLDEIMLAHQRLGLVASQSAVSYVLAGMVGGPPVAELEHLEVLMDAVDHSFVDAHVVAVSPFRRLRHRLEAVLARDAEVLFRVPVEIVAAEH
jgi:hypothetical protein